MIWPDLYVRESEGRGRGMFTGSDIAAGTVIEESPVVVMSPAERRLLDQTRLHDYIFEWHGQEPDGCCMAMGFVPVYNHVSPSNCEYEMDYETDTIRIVAMRDIAAGEELTINYNGDFDDPSTVWFEAH